jgi:hypothetical protein
MLRRVALGLPALALTVPLQSWGKSSPTYRFGILAPDRDGYYRLAQETTRIPRRYKATGFRFGIEFTNWDRVPLDWYEVIHAPKAFGQVTGNATQAAPQVLRSKTLHTDEARVTNDNWIDEGDPLGRYRLELFVNDARVYAVDFDLVAD